MGVAMSSHVDIEVDQVWTAGRVLDGEAQLLGRLALGRDVRCLAGVDVATGLHPDAQTLVEMQDRAAPPDDDARRSDVGGPGMLVAGCGQAAQLGQEALPGRHLTW